MPVRKAKSSWAGTLKAGKGQMELGSGAFKGQYSFKSRFAEGAGTNPEELIGAAHSGCFAMALANILAESGYSPERIDAEAEVTLVEKEGGFQIDAIELDAVGQVPDIEEAAFREKAEEAKENCPVSKAISDSVQVSLKARLEK